MHGNRLYIRLYSRSAAAIRARYGEDFLYLRLCLDRFLREVKQFFAGGLYVGLGEYGRNNGASGDACALEFCDVLFLDASDGDDGDVHGLAYVAECSEGCCLGVAFSARGENGSGSKIVGSPFLRPERFLNAVDGYADDLIRSQSGAHVSGLHIALSHMHSVGSAGDGYIHVVVDDKGYVVALAEFFYLNSLGEKRIIVQLLFTKLYERRASFKSVPDLFGEGSAAKPTPVRNGVKQHIFFNGSHNQPFFPMFRRPY